MSQVVFNERRFMLGNDHSDTITAMGNFTTMLCRKDKSVSDRNISNRSRRIVSVQKDEQQTFAQDSQICTILKVFCQELLVAFHGVVSLNSWLCEIRLAWDLANLKPHGQPFRQSLGMDLALTSDGANIQATSCAAYLRVLEQPDEPLRPKNSEFSRITAFVNSNALSTSSS